MGEMKMKTDMNKRMKEMYKEERSKKMHKKQRKIRV
jgi:hypothetical protein